jgi:anti-sigma B factor antagonist
MPASSVASRSIERRVGFETELAPSHPHSDSQIDRITSARDANHVIGKFRDRQQLGEAKRSCRSPAQAADAGSYRPQRWRVGAAQRMVAMSNGDTLQTVMAEDKLRLQILDGARPGETVMVLQGVLNAETAFQFRDSVRQNESATLVVDMSRVRYVDSSGLGVLIGAYVSFERNCRHLLLAGLNDRIWDLFRKCKIEDVFTRYPTVADAEQTMAI